MNRPWAAAPFRRVASVLVRAATTAVLLTAAAGASATPAAAARPAAHRASAAEAAPADAERQAALVAAEDRWLNQVRAVTAVAPLRDLLSRAPGSTTQKWDRPYRLDTAGGYTLVLTARTAAYTVDDLLRLAPQTFVRQQQGAYLLTENIYINSGARLKLAHPGGLELRLASRSSGFVAIVSFGGGLTLEGTKQAPVRVTSWDPRTGKPDTDVRDGRAYLRAIGGNFAMSHTRAAHLGFWSGRTGGVSLTGTDRPDTGAVEGPSAATPGRILPGEVRVLSGGRVASPDSRFTVPSLSYVSGTIGDSEFVGNAYGLFVSSADGIKITDTKVRDSMQHGVVLHRFATNAVIERTVSQHNGGDGFLLSRATQQVRITNTTAERNGGNGFTLSGRPLADGPSASGQSTASYGANTVSHSTARGNGHYGFEILGGLSVSIQENQIEGGDMGIVARLGVRDLTLTANRLTDQRRQAIAIRDGVAGARINGNLIESTQTGVYVRDSVAEVRGNTIHDANSHGVTFVGAVGGSVAAGNAITGIGPSAVDTGRAEGKLTVRDNQTDAWLDTSTLWARVRHYASPMTLLWTTILLLIVVLAFRRRREDHGHPYAATKPLFPGEPPPARTGPGRPSPRDTARGRARVVMAE
ncbi:right-handed parallel beta-helix repeat-containing protein [Catellatospora sp. NPDC049111]|uniref:right-handed parallel beta-helix repeat-containing protein n=1 Tax=Catellatospora sp. NPDC049111 TaxID=3155271 RepID=UPI00340D0D43